jgi:hypothetical protein
MQYSKTLTCILIFFFLAIGIYTFFAFQKEGIQLFSIFTSQIQSLTWAGQFNLDFTSYLVLSGLWIMWRNQFTVSSIFLGTTAMILGMIFLAPYLLFLLNREKCDLKKVLIGRNE